MLIRLGAKDAERLVSRLFNWKFTQATQCLAGQHIEVAETVRALSRMFGNCGWEDGDMGRVVSAAVRHLIGEDPGTC